MMAAAAVAPVPMRSPFRRAHRASPSAATRQTLRLHEVGRRLQRRIWRGASPLCAVNGSSSTSETVHCVYIEHTDAFQVMYHTNYIILLARDRHARLTRWFGSMAVTERCVALERLKFSAAARLGSHLAVRSELVGASMIDVGDGASATTSSASMLRMRWRQRIFEIDLEASGRGEALLVEATVVTAVRLPDGDVLSEDNLGCKIEDRRMEPAGGRPMSDEPMPPVEGSTLTTRITLWPDERCGRWDARVLRWFERSRTESIGSAANLRRLQEDFGKLIVVASIRDLRLASKLRDGDEMDLAEQEFIDIRSDLSIRLSRTTMLFRHAAVTRTGRVLASAEVTCVCVDASSFQLCALPADVGLG